MWGEPTFFFIVLVSLLIDYYAVQLIDYAEGGLKKRLLQLVVSLNVLNLVIHKYLMFVVFNMSEVFRAAGMGELSAVWIALPIGISFITFQKISYAVDVYRGIRPSMERFVDYGLYIMFFPQLIAGPIIRFHEVADQIKDRLQQENIDSKLIGFKRFIIGLSKKLLIANPLGLFVNEVFELLPLGIGMGLAWLGIIAYSFQIYFDFSAYSDMAIGLARMVGFKFPENFQFPYISQSITEFWRRWHITLSKWMRDYLYIPLGGNRVSTARLYLNLWIVFLISGLWHGAQWTFVIWGAFHGLWLVVERLFLEKQMAKWKKFPRIAFTYVIVLIGWVFFRASSLPEALSYIGQMFSFSAGDIFIPIDAYLLCILLLATIFSFMGAWPKIERMVEDLLQQPLSSRAVLWQMGLMIVLGFLCITELYASGFNPFIYFRF